MEFWFRVLIGIKFYKTRVRKFIGVVLKIKFYFETIQNSGSTKWNLTVKLNLNSIVIHPICTGNGRPQ